MEEVAMRTSTAAVCAAVLATVPLAACFHSTELAATWAEPTAQPLNFHKTVAVFVTKDEALRRSVEDRIAGKFPGGVPSYRVMNTIKSTEPADILDQLRHQGFDGAVIMRVADVSTQLNYVPGSYWYGAPYYTFGGYWSAAWAYPYDPGYVATDKIVTVETQVYSLPKDKLVFAARSETTNPASAAKLTDSVLRHVTKDMQKKGLLAFADDASGVPSATSTHD
jgi:hypothetical protein